MEWWQTCWCNCVTDSKAWSEYKVDKVWNAFYYLLLILSCSLSLKLMVYDNTQKKPYNGWKKDINLVHFFCVLWVLDVPYLQLLLPVYVPLHASFLLHVIFRGPFFYSVTTGIWQMFFHKKKIISIPIKDVFLMICLGLENYHHVPYIHFPLFSLGK